ncbi:ATP-dependent 6-phosphofructokinase 4, chloroplastic [Vitis vinifera]|uniref:ATP-dependent 6-phosphofructokinase 4, chloroplastic n=1 Tax=Vitis vinifera TaxID=29760 RepID=A0A438GQD3_VITVI|nr:ATP-dependent 6-phosphofructokinase 4, chloroplastic [Vitis vinifera]
MATSSNPGRQPKALNQQQNIVGMSQGIRTSARRHQPVAINNIAKVTITASMNVNKEQNGIGQKSYPNPLQQNLAYTIVKLLFKREVLEEFIFGRAGPREKVYFKSEEVRACIVTCGGLCPGINTVIREIVCGLNYMYGVHDILGIEVG